MTTPNPKVAAWAESMGYRWDENNQWWVKIDFGVLGIEQLTFMYRQVVQARIDELKRLNPASSIEVVIGTHATKGGWRVGEKIRDVICTTTRRQLVSERIAELEAELQELEEEK